MKFHGVLYKVPDRILKKKIEDILNFIELWDRKNDLVNHFSGGMKRRQIARGLLHIPEVLFMYEPTIGLDPQTRNHIWKYLKNFNGRLIAEDSPEVLKNKNGAKTMEEAPGLYTQKNT